MVCLEISRKASAILDDEAHKIEVEEPLNLGTQAAIDEEVEVEGDQSRGGHFESTSRPWKR